MSMSAWFWTSEAFGLSETEWIKASDFSVSETIVIRRYIKWWSESESESESETERGNQEV